MNTTVTAILLCDILQQLPFQYCTGNNYCVHTRLSMFFVILSQKSHGRFAKVVFEKDRHRESCETAEVCSHTRCNPFYHYIPAKKSHTSLK